MIRWLIATLMLVAAGAAHGQLNVVATTSNMGMLAETVGGEHVRVTVLAPPDRDVHYLEARPAMMAALRRADLLLAVGAELEVGWLPAAISGAGNARVRPGRTGYFEAAAQVDRIEEGRPADRALGDVHPAGNPHVYLDPERMARIARTLAERLAEMDAANAERFRANARAFAEGVEARIDGWRERAEGAPGVVIFHADADYLMRLLDVPVHGYLEPVPGVPPTGAHLRELVRRLEGERGVIIRYPYQSERATRFLAGRLDMEVHELKQGVEVGGSAEDYFALIDRWVEAIASAK